MRVEYGSKGASSQALRLSNSIPSTYTIYKDESDYYGEANSPDLADITAGTDASTVIQAAIDALTTGGSILIKEGTYEIATTLSMGKASTFYILAGEGHGTVLKASDTLGAVLDLKVGGWQIIRDMKLDGDDKTTDVIDCSRGAQTYTNLIFENVRVMNSTVGWNIVGTDGNSWFNCESDNIDDDTIQGNGSGLQRIFGGALDGDVHSIDSQSGSYVWMLEGVAFGPIVSRGSDKFFISGGYSEGDFYANLNGGSASSYLWLDRCFLKQDNAANANIRGTWKEVSITDCMFTALGANNLVITSNLSLNGHNEFDQSIDYTNSLVYENSGAGSIANGGTTSGAITHGLASTPTAQDFIITGKEVPTNDLGAVYVDTITATQFTVHTKNDPGASNWDFGWKVKI